MILFFGVSPASQVFKLATMSSAPAIKSFYCYGCLGDRPENFVSFPCGHGVCSPCFRGQMKASQAGAQALACGSCRAQVSSASKVFDVAALLAKTDKARDVNANIDQADPRYRWRVAAILGIRCLVPWAPLEIEYKVQWAKPTGPGRRSYAPTWERAPFFDDPTLLEAFHTKHGLLSSSHPDFDWSVQMEFQAPKKHKVNGKPLYKCSERWCPHTSSKKCNMEAHVKSQHRVPGSDVVRVPCPVPECSLTYESQGSMKKHFMKVHQKEKEEVRVRSVVDMPAPVACPLPVAPQ
ncbi:MAG: hypothetical protein P4L81_06050 [Candidatus Pacebacteria bacterium]|nr:hypothetical protein [Candidatus Paceibacterota bacterium]